MGEEVEQLGLAARLDRLASTVDRLVARVGEQEDAVAERLSALGGRLDEAVARIDLAQRDAEERSTARAAQVAAGTRVHVEEVLAEVREELVEAQRRGDRAAHERAEAIERAVGRVDEVLPGLHDSAARIGSHAAGLQVTSTALAAYAQEALEATEPLGPMLEGQLAALRRRVDELDDARVAAVGEQLAATTAAVQRLREELHGTVDERLQAATAAVEALRADVGGQVEERLGAVTTATDELRAGLDAHVEERLAAVATSVDELRDRLGTTVEQQLDAVTTAVERLEEGFEDRVARALREGTARVAEELRTTVDELHGRLASDAEALPQRIEEGLGPTVTAAAAGLGARVDDVRDQVEVLTGSQRQLLGEVREEAAGQREQVAEQRADTAGALERLREQFAEALEEQRRLVERSLDEQRALVDRARVEQRHALEEQREQHTGAIASYGEALEEQRHELRALAARLVAQVEDAVDGPRGGDRD